MSAKGARIYLSAVELESLHAANGYLSALLEAASGDAAELIATKQGLFSVIEKAWRAQRSAGRRKTVKAALRAARDE